MPELVDGFGPLKQRKTIEEQYEHVLRIDTRMREMARQIPTFLLREVTNEHLDKPWLSIARRSLAITAADKVC